MPISVLIFDFASAELLFYSGTPNVLTCFARVSEKVTFTSKQAGSIFSTTSGVKTMCRARQRTVLAVETIQATFHTGLILITRAVGACNVTISSATTMYRKKLSIRWFSKDNRSRLLEVNENTFRRSNSSFLFWLTFHIVG